MEVKRGDIWFCNIPKTMENVQYGVRPAIVISNNKANYFSPIVTICPITSRCKKKDMNTHVPILLDEPSFIICEQILSVNKKCLFRFVFNIGNEKMLEVDEALSIQLQKADFKKQDNDIEIYQTALRQVKSIEFLEEFVLHHEESKEIMNSLYIQIAELQDYCKIHNIDITKIYKSKLNIPITSVKVG